MKTKRILAILCLLFTVTAFAHASGSRPQKVDIIASAGFFELDGRTIASKCYVSNSRQQRQINQAVNAYNEALHKIYKNNSKDVKVLEAMEAMIKKNNGRSPMNVDKDELREIVKRLKKQTSKVHNNLNQDMRNIMYASSENRWRSYYENVCRNKDFSPKNKNSYNNNSYNKNNYHKDSRPKF